MRTTLLLLAATLFWPPDLTAQAVAQPADKPLYAPSLVIAGPNDLAGLTLASEPGFPFTATVEIENQSVLPGGEVIVHRLRGQVARSASGSLRTLVDLNVLGQPRIPSNVTIHIYDARRKADITLFPAAKVAFVNLEEPPATPSARHMHRQGSEPLPLLVEPAQFAQFGDSLQPSDPVQVTREDLGIETVDGQPLRHGRETFRFPASLSPDKKASTTITEYWYAQDLQAFVKIVRHISGGATQTLLLRDIRRENPPANLFRIPANHKITGLPLTETPHENFCPLL